MKNEKWNWPDWFLSLLFVVTFCVAPILYNMWQKEKNVASEYKKAYFDLREISEKIVSNEADANDLINFFREKEEHEKLMNDLANELSKIYDEVY
ncbi:MAG: hypothetical protein ABIG87_01510 [Patescibacteria group bacterium]